MLSKKIDFAVIIGVKNANPNGDPLNGNRPRVNYDGYGEMSDVCLKRKVRNRLLDGGEAILVQSDDYRRDEYRSIKDRYDSNDEIKNLSKEKDDKNKAKVDRQKQAKIACKTWYDVRAFGQVLAFKKNSKKKGNDEESNEDSVSIGIRGPVSMQSAFSIEPVGVESLQIIKSVNLETNTDPDKKASDTMGMKHRVDKGVYVSFGSINRQLAEKTGFSDEDAEKLKQAMQKMFENDESSARPAGSMEVLKVIWWTHTERTLSSAEVHRSLNVNPDGTYTLKKLEGVPAQEFDGQ
jgi:CRISPR-associated protein Csd2